MVAFKGGNNTGGQNVDYYDNPNYDPNNEGKGGAASKDNTVSYFRSKDNERLNPGGVGNPQINPKFSQPATSKLGKLSKFGMSFDPQDPDTYYDQSQRVPQGQLTENLYDTSRRIGNMDFIEQTSRYAKGTPMPKTVAGVNQELQAVKARTRDAAMEVRGMVFDFIDAHRSNLIEHKNDIVNEYFGREDSGTTMMFNEKDIEDKFFPDDASKKAARKELQKMVSFTDAASDITREYSTLGQLAETIVGDTPETPMGIMDHGIRGQIGEPKLVNETITAANYKKSLDAYSQWKAKKGIPKIVRLISRLP